MLFTHGWLANANLWRKVVDRLHGRFRCIVLDLPLGSHRKPMEADADLSPGGIAHLVASAAEQLDLYGATRVGNDSGGAYAQIALTRHAGLAKRIDRLVLTSCETPHDEWPPKPFDGLPAAARDPDGLEQLLNALADPAVRKSPVAYGLLLKHETDSAAIDSYALPASRERRVLGDVARVMAATRTAPVRAAGQRLIEGDLPMRLIWSEEDEVFPIAHAERYAEALSRGQLVRITDSYSFTPEDQPEAVAEAIASFAS
jgi:pimeloyl-ACP methyl ester carboxylesterase